MDLLVSCSVMMDLLRAELLLQECRLTECLVPAVLPRLVISQDVDLLETLAVQLGLSLKDMLVHYGHHTVAYILLEGTHNIDEYASFMFQQTGAALKYESLAGNLYRKI